MINRVCFFILLCLISACAKIKTIGTKKHKFNAPSSKIIWLQIAGFEREHIALLKLAKTDSMKPLSFEKSVCLGGAWGHNLYELRPDASLSFLGQLTGSLNVKGSCSDYDKKPLWHYLADFSFKTIILESGASEKESLDKSSKCERYGNFVNGASLVRMSKRKSSDQLMFHFQEVQELQTDKIYYDKSCQEKDCQSSLYSNMISLWDNFLNKREKSVLIVRDFSYAKALKSGNLTKALEILTDIERAYSRFIEDKDDNTLVLLTSGEPLKLDFPKQGKNWIGYVNKKNNIIRRSSLISPIFSFGAKAENFCGILNESLVMERILWSPKESDLLDNFFSN